MQKADILIVTDPEKAYGVEHGYYPELEKPRKNGILTIVSISHITEQMELRSKPKGTGSDTYVLNPFSGQYVSFDSENILDIFAESQSNAVKETLVKMGAKYICITEEVNNIETSEQNIKLKGGKKMGKASLVGGHERKMSLDIKSIIKSVDEGRVAKPAVEVKKYMEMHGLMHDDRLRSFLERLESDGELKGKEEYHIVLLSSLNDTLKLGASINVKSVFNGKVDFSTENNRIHKIEKKLVVYFDDSYKSELELLRKEAEEDNKKFSLRNNENK